VTSPFITYLEEFEQLNDVEQQLIQSHLKFGRVPAKTFLLRAGDISNKIYFILRGVVGDFYFDQQGNEIVKSFHAENQFVVDLTSYQQRGPSQFYFQALSDLEFVYFSKLSDQQLSRELPKWSSLVRRISEYLLAEKVDKASFYLHLSAEQRYQHFVASFPNLESRVQLGHVASFLGITQPSLSRIRKKLALI
jgi:CRP-like cAMP-binding protein